MRTGGSSGSRPASHLAGAARRRVALPPARCARALGRRLRRKVGRRLARLALVACFAIPSAIASGSADAAGVDRPLRIDGSSSCQPIVSSVTECSGSFTGTHLGTGTHTRRVTLTGPFVKGCAPGGRVGSFTAANGDVVFHQGSGILCRTPRGISFTGTYTITGGTGRFAGASGEGTFNGVGGAIIVRGTIRY